MENYIVIRIVRKERCVFNVLAIISILRSEEAGKKPIPCWTWTRVYREMNLEIYLLFIYHLAQC